MLAPGELTILDVSGKEVDRTFPSTQGHCTQPTLSGRTVNEPELVRVYRTRVAERLSRMADEIPRL